MLPDIPPEVRPWLGQALLGLLIGFIAWIGRSLIKRAVLRVDDHEVRIGAIEQKFISREEFQRYMEQVRLDRAAMHAENLASIAALRESVDRVNTNIINTLAQQLKR